MPEFYADLPVSASTAYAQLQTAALAVERVVSLPAPARYAVHKLLIVGKRSGTFKAKTSKDVAQSASLLAYFAANDPDAVRDVWGDALARGPLWRRRAREGRKALALKAPRLAADPLHD